MKSPSADVVLLVLVAYGYALAIVMESSWPLPIKIIVGLAGVLIATWSCAQAIEYFWGKYKQFGPSILTALQHSWLESPWKSTLWVAVLFGVFFGICAAIVFSTWGHFQSQRKQAERAEQAPAAARPSQSTSSPVNQSPPTEPFNSGFTSGIIVKDTKNLQAFGNVFENVGALANVERSEDIQIFNNRITNQPPNPKSDSESQSKPELEGTWKTLYFARTLPTTPGTPEKKRHIRFWEFDWRAALPC